MEASEKIAEELDRLMDSTEDVKRLENVTQLIRILTELPIKLNLWRSQNIAFEMAEKFHKQMKERKDEQSRLWVSVFERLCESIGIRLV